VVSGLIARSTAVVRAKVLNADPGWRCPWAARLNCASSYTPLEAIARTNPVFGSIETTAADGSSE
jgi:hypothetical protein